MNDKFVHLTNNSVAKYFKGPEGEIEGNMWYSEDF